MNGFGRKCRRKRSTTAIHKKGKETNSSLEIFWDTKLEVASFLSSSEASPSLGLSVDT